MDLFIEFSFLHCVEAGSTIINQGEAGDYFYIIKSGKVEYIIDGKKENYQGGKADSFGG